MSEFTSSHNQDPQRSGLSPEEFDDAEKTLQGFISAFANRIQEPGISPEGQAQIADGVLVPMVEVYLSNGEQYDLKPAARDAITAMALGVVQHPAVIEGFAARLSRGGRVSRETIDMMTRDAHERADVRLNHPESSREVDLMKAVGVINTLDKGIGNGVYDAQGPDSRASYAYAAGIYAQFPAHMQEARMALGRIAPPQEAVPPTDMSHLEDRLGGQ